METMLTTDRWTVCGMLKTILASAVVAGLACQPATAQKSAVSYGTPDFTNLSNVHPQDLKNLRLHILASRYQCKTAMGAREWSAEHRWTVQCDKYSYDVHDRGGRYVVIPQSRK
jgi:hypothetical protein